MPSSRTLSARGMASPDEECGTKPPTASGVPCPRPRCSSFQKKTTAKIRRSKRSLVSLPRMVDRNLPFHQSRNGMRIQNTDRRLLLPLVMQDWFHTLLRLDACVSVTSLLSLWVCMVGVFAGAYWYLDGKVYNVVDCGMGPTDGESISFSGAFAFSLETCTTVGYGLPGTSTSFFEKGCTAIQGTIFLQMLWSMMFNAFLFAFFYSLLSKSEFRSSQIIFTDKLLVNVVGSSSSIEGNRAYVRLQCYDIDSAHPLVEAHARMYVLDHKLKMHPLRLIDPNDDLGGVLYPSVPTDIVHHIDCHSPLFPRRLPLVEKSHGLVLRSIDSYTGNREEIACPVCGETYGTYERLKLHVEYNAMMEAEAVDAESKYPPGKSHIGFQLPAIEPLTLDEVRGHIETTLSEIIVVVEAIDPQLSGTFQSLQSYKYEDIEFGAEFAECMYTNSEGTEFLVDMKQFHKTHKQSDGGEHEHSGDATNGNAVIAMQLSHISEGSTENEGKEGKGENGNDDDDDNDNNNDDDDDDDSLLESESSYFRRDYDTFSSFRGTGSMVVDFFSGRERSNRPEDSSNSYPAGHRRSLHRATMGANERTPIHDRQASYSAYL